MLPLYIKVMNIFCLGAVMAAGYLIGSIPFGLIFTHLAGLGDIRTIGSGNTGATNVLRTGNRKIAAFTLLCDILKGLIAVLIFSVYGPVLGIIAGLFAFLGHVFPIWLGFRGGKGVATYLGVLIGAIWPYAIIFNLIWLMTAIITRYSSFSAILATVVVTVFAFLSLPSTTSWSIILMGTIIIVKHYTNIQRLCKRTENRIGQKAK